MPTPQCGETTAASAPHYVESPLERAEHALDALEVRWAEAAWVEMDARELAVEFRRVLQAQPDLVGRRLRSTWIEEHYQRFCRSVGVTWPPPFKDFAKELAQLMPKKRKEEWRDGERVTTYMTYLIPDPGAAVVSLADEQRKRAL